MIECVVNISEGRNKSAIDTIGAAAGAHLIDVHYDADHNRSVMTIAGSKTECLNAVWELTKTAIDTISIQFHSGVHPRTGVVDVVPFIDLETMTPDYSSRNLFAEKLSDELKVPVFLYGDDIRTLPEIRKSAFKTLNPDFGPRHPHRSAGATAVGARGPLVAYNVLIETDIAQAKRLAKDIRSTSCRSLAFDTIKGPQISMNLIDPMNYGPADAVNHINFFLKKHQIQGKIKSCELVGLLPQKSLDRVDQSLWEFLDLDPIKTIEYSISKQLGSLE